MLDKNKQDPGLETALAAAKAAIANVSQADVHHALEERLGLFEVCLRLADPSHVEHAEKVTGQAEGLAKSIEAGQYPEDAFADIPRLAEALAVYALRQGSAAKEIDLALHVVQLPGADPGRGLLDQLRARGIQIWLKADELPPRATFTSNRNEWERLGNKPSSATHVPPGVINAWLCECLLRYAQAERRTGDAANATRDQLAAGRFAAQLRTRNPKAPPPAYVDYVCATEHRIGLKWSDIDDTRLDQILSDPSALSPLGRRLALAVVRRLRRPPLEERGHPGHRGGCRLAAAESTGRHAGRSISRGGGRPALRPAPRRPPTCRRPAGARPQDGGGHRLAPT